MSNICIAVLIGIPAAGKTTFCEIYKQRFANHERNVTLVNYDTMCSDFTSSSRKSVLKYVDTLIQNCQRIVNTCKNVVIIDDNMFYKSMRSDYIKMCKLYKIGFIQAYFDIDLNLALLRNKQREISHQVPDRIIIDMFKKIEIPNKNVVVIKSEDAYSLDLFNEFNEKIDSAMSNPLQVNEIIENIVEESRLQAIDLVLRRIVGEKVSQNKLHGQKFNLIKRNLFKHIKNGNIDMENVNDLYNYLLVFFNI